MNKITFTLLFATTLVAGACTSDDNSTSNNNGTDAGKTMIELGGAGENVSSRAGFTGAATTLKIHYVSSRKAKDDSSFPYNDGLNDDGSAKGNLYMTSSAIAAIDTEKTDASVSAVSQTTEANGTKRYWDDIHGKNSLLSLYAIAVPDKSSITKNGTKFNAWDTNQKEGITTAVANTIAWEVSSSQTSTTISDEDLAYSNNIKGKDVIGYDVENKKFQSANLIFNHSLSRFTINVKKGAGFGDFDTEFNVTVKLLKQTTGGTLDVSSGTWTSTTKEKEKEVTITNTKSDYKVSDVKVGYTYNAQVLPGVALKDVTATMLSIVVDGNNYNISGNDIYNALTANSQNLTDAESLKQGKNYNLTVTINKKGIEIASAKLIEWTNVTGSELTPSNAIALTASMESSAGTQTSIASDIYRSTTLATGYTNKNTLSATNTLGSAWYWPDNSTSYYFRTISPQGTTVTTATNDNITMTGGKIADGNDYIWGAPLEEKHSSSDPHTFTYSTENGYYTYLYPAIGVTNSEIHITQFHMMSNIEVQLSTSNDASAVNLSDATVTIKGHKTIATLNLSNALITPTGGVSRGESLTVKETGTFTWRTIPQSLTDVTIVITANGNNYEVKLADIIKSGTTDDKISSWIPGQSYIYQFKITKTGIKITSAKLVDWETVTSTIKDINLEN